MIQLKQAFLLTLFVFMLAACATLNQSKPHEVNESAYIGQVKHFTYYLQQHDLMTTSFVVAAFAAEPLNAIVSGLRMPRGMKREFHAYGANPTELTPTEAQKPPTLLLHGYKHNQSAFIPMLRYFAKRHYNGPIFTVNLQSDNEVLRQRTIDQKLDEIDALYREQGVIPRPGEPHIRGVIIGHSLGADEAVLLEKRDSTQRRLVLLGALKHSSRPLPQVYFNAVPDVILSLPSEVMDPIIPVGEVHQVDTGHLGLLSHPKVLEACFEVINSFNFATP